MSGRLPTSDLFAIANEITTDSVLSDSAKRFKAASMKQKENAANALDDENIRWEIAIASFREGNYQETINQLEDDADLMPERDFLLLRALANIELNQNVKEARQNLLKNFNCLDQTKLNPEEKILVFKYVSEFKKMACLEKKKMAYLEKDYQAPIKLNALKLEEKQKQRLTEAYLKKAADAEMQKQYQKAEELYEKAVNLNSKSYELYGKRVELLERLNLLDAAVIQYNICMSLMVNHAGGFLALIDQKSKEQQASRQNLKIYLQLIDLYWHAIEHAVHTDDFKTAADFYNQGRALCLKHHHEVKIANAKHPDENKLSKIHEFFTDVVDESDSQPMLFGISNEQLLEVQFLSKQERDKKAAAEKKQKQERVEKRLNQLSEECVKDALDIELTNLRKESLDNEIKKQAEYALAVLLEGFISPELKLVADTAIKEEMESLKYPHIFDTLYRYGFTNTKAYGGFVRDGGGTDVDLVTAVKKEDQQKKLEELKQIFPGSFTSTVRKINGEEIHILHLRKDKDSPYQMTIRLSDALIHSEEADAVNLDFYQNACYLDKTGNKSDPSGKAFQQAKEKKLELIGGVARLYKDPEIALRALDSRAKSRGVFLSDEVVSVIKSAEYKRALSRFTELNPHTINSALAKLFLNGHAVENFSHLFTLSLLPLFFPCESEYQWCDYVMKEVDEKFKSNDNLKPRLEDIYIPMMVAIAERQSKSVEEVKKSVPLFHAYFSRKESNNSENQKRAFAARVNSWQMIWEKNHSPSPPSKHSPPPVTSDRVSPLLPTFFQPSGNQLSPAPHSPASLTSSSSPEISSSSVSSKSPTPSSSPVFLSHAMEQKSKKKSRRRGRFNAKNNTSGQAIDSENYFFQQQYVGGAAAAHYQSPPGLIGQARNAVMFSPLPAPVTTQRQAVICLTNYRYSPPS